MPREPDIAQIIEVFSHVHIHRRIAELIRHHSSNPTDIRGIALDAVNVSKSRFVLELGCGFGSFLSALKGRLPPDAVLTGLDIIPAYEQPFLDACRNAGIKGRFLSSGVAQIDAFPQNTYDLVLCSFALYFFPDILPQVSRILKPGGAFIAITHDLKNMGELIDITKEIMKANGWLEGERLPIERIIGRFSAENGDSLLRPWFGRVQAIDYRNALVFEPADIQQLVEYFCFKGSLFLGGTDHETQTIVHRLAAELERSSLRRHGLILSKDDRIFVCGEPKGKTP